LAHNNWQYVMQFLPARSEPRRRRNLDGKVVALAASGGVSGVFLITALGEFQAQPIPVSKMQSLHFLEQHKQLPCLRNYPIVSGTDKINDKLTLPRNIHFALRNMPFGQR
jgi:hypothetical protein